MTPSQVISALQRLSTIRQPVLLWGAPGIGKCQIVSQVAAMRGHRVAMTGTGGYLARVGHWFKESF